MHADQRYKIIILIKSDFYLKIEIQKGFFKFVNKTIERIKSLILLKDEYDKIIDTSQIIDSSQAFFIDSKFFFSTYIIRMMVKCHVLKNLMKT